MKECKQHSELYMSVLPDGTSDLCFRINLNCAVSTAVGIEQAPDTPLQLCLSCQRVHIYSTWTRKL